MRGGTCRLKYDVVGVIDLFWAHLGVDRKEKGLAPTMQTIIAAGIPRSGSTWLFNAVRLLEKYKYENVYCAWIDDHEDVKCDVRLIKVHDIDEKYISEANLVFCTHRDLRDIVVSLCSMSWLREDEMLSAASNIRRIHEFWSAQSCLDLSYEKIVFDPIGSLTSIARALDVRVSEGLIREIERAIPTKTELSCRDYDVVSLLHPGHVTDGRPGRWVEQLSPVIAEEIWRCHADWLQARAYTRHGPQ